MRNDKLGKMIYRIMSLTLVCVMLISMLASCGIVDGILGNGANSGTQGDDPADNTGDNTQGDNTQSDNTQNNGNNTNDDAKGVVYSKIIYTGSPNAVTELRAAMMSLIGPTVTATLYSEVAASDGEVVLGQTDRAISSAARDELVKLIDASTVYDCGYIIYCYGKSVGVYWSSPDMEDIAIADFLNVCVEDMKLELEQGVIKSQLYVRSEFDTQKAWLALSAQAPDDVVKALKKLYSYYNGAQIVDWMANLYDPEIGAFYYSISARDNEPFRPDIESTHQILSLLVSCGAIGDRNELPAEVKEKIVKFAQNTQCADDGYFYHPQWPQGRENLNTDRYGRDLSRAIQLITNLDYDIDGDGIDDQHLPFYCTPNNNTKCALHYGTDEKCSFPVTRYVDHLSASISGCVTRALSSTVSSAISKVPTSTVKSVVSSHPDYTSRETFKAWLYEYNASIKENSGKAHNLSAISGEINAHGYGDIVCEMIATAQREVYEEQIAAGIEPTGLWQRNVDYNAVWGILKYASYYNGAHWKTPMEMKYITAMVKTCVRVIELPADGDYEANDIYNMWNAVDRILTHVEKHYTSTEILQVYEILRENASSLIDNTILKLQPFKREDGSFSYRSNGRSLATIYGTPISLGAIEGDVNAVALCCNMYEGIYRALGYSEVPLFSKADGERFIDTVLYCSPIEKIEKDVDIIDFETPTLPQGFSTALKSPGSIGAIVEDPVDPANNAFHFLSTTPTSGADHIDIATYELGSNCYVADFDLYVASEGTDDGYVFQIFVGDAYIIAINKSGSTVTIKDDINGSGTASKTWGKVSTDEWVRITCEVYVPGEDTNGLSEPQIKFWINGEYCGTTNGFYNKNGSGSFIENYTTVLFWSMKKKATNVYFDNCYFAADDKVFDADEEYFEDVRE